MSNSQPVLGGERLSVGIEELIRTHGEPPWHAQLIANHGFVVTAICQNPGHHNDWHYHFQDECWYVHQGELSWTLEGHDEPIRVGAGEWMLVPADTFHLIQVHGSGPSIRLAVSFREEFHRHTRKGITPPEPPRDDT